MPDGLRAVGAVYKSRSLREAAAAATGENHDNGDATAAPPAKPKPSTQIIQRTTTTRTITTIYRKKNRNGRRPPPPPPRVNADAKSTSTSTTVQPDPTEKHEANAEAAANRVAQIKAEQQKKRDEVADAARVRAEADAATAKAAIAAAKQRTKQKRRRELMAKAAAARKAAEEVAAAKAAASKRAPPSQRVIRERLRKAKQNLAFPLQASRSGSGTGAPAAANRAEAYQLPPPSLRVKPDSSSRRALQLEWSIDEEIPVEILFFLVEWTNASAEQAAGATLVANLERNSATDAKNRPQPLPTQAEHVKNKSVDSKIQSRLRKRLAQAIANGVGGVNPGQSSFVVPHADASKKPGDWTVLYSDPPEPGFRISGGVQVKNLHDNCALRLRVRAYSTHRTAGLPAEALFCTTPSTASPPQLADPAAAMKSCMAPASPRPPKSTSLRCRNRARVQSSCAFQKLLCSLPETTVVACRRAQRSRTASKGTGMCFLFLGDEARTRCGHRCVVHEFCCKFFPAFRQLKHPVRSLKQKKARSQRTPQELGSPRGRSIPVHRLIEAVCEDRNLQHLLVSLPANRYLLSRQKQGGTDHHLLLGGTRGANRGNNRQYFTTLQGLQNLEQPEVSFAEFLKMVFGDPKPLVNRSLSAPWRQAGPGEVPPLALVVQYFAQLQPDPHSKSGSKSESNWHDVVTISQYQDRKDTIVALAGLEAGQFFALRTVHENVSGQRGYASPHCVATAALPKPQLEVVSINSVQPNSGEKYRMELAINFETYSHLFNKAAKDTDQLVAATVKKYMLKFKTLAARFGSDSVSAVKTWISTLLCALGTPAGMQAPVFLHT